MKRRKPLHRTTPLKSRKRLRSRTPLNKSKHHRIRPTGKRHARLTASGLRFGPLAVYVRGKPCAVPECKHLGEPAHCRSRGAGFQDWLPDGGGNLGPLCHDHHMERDHALDAIGPAAFDAKYGIDFADICYHYGEALRHRSPEVCPDVQDQ